MTSSSPARSADTPDPELINTCVHCGFCLPTCPTYAVAHEEMDSPRGRIYLMRAVHEGRAAIDAAYVQHFDNCLGCVACVTACPSGVQYGSLIEQARAQIEATHTRPTADRWLRTVIFAVFPHPARLRVALLPMPLYQAVEGLLDRLGVIRRLPARLRAMLAVAPRVSFADLLRARTPERTAASAPQRDTVGLLTGCAQQVFFSRVNDATCRVLSAEGVEVVAPPTQRCCGALSLHAGRLDEARAAARETIACFEQARVSTVVVNAAGCGSAMKEYGHLLAADAAWADRAHAFSARVRDVSEYLVGLGPPRAPRRPLPLRVAYQDACHLAHAQRIRQEPRDLLKTIPALTLVESPDAELCCGSAGIYNLLEPETAEQLGTRKFAALTTGAPDVIASANPGCALQIAAAARRAGWNVVVKHPIELVDEAIGN